MMTRKTRTKSKRVRRLTGSAMAVLLAVSFGTSGAYAYENGSVPQGQTAGGQTATATTMTGGKTAGLLPGDFFYFIKSVYENIRLALSSNDLKKAQLFAEFAQTRLSETNALLAKGKTEEAVQSIQKSLEAQQSAVEKTERAYGISTADAALAASTTEQSSVQPTGTQPSKEALAGHKIKTDLQHNIVALTAALEKVDNPKAQLALMKNIEKSFAHLEEKLAKIERKKEAEPVSPSVNSAAPQVTASLEVSSTRIVQGNVDDIKVKDRAESTESQAAQAEARQERAEKADKSEKLEKHEREEKADKSEKLEKAEKPDKSENREKEEKKDKTNRPANEQKKSESKGKENDKHNDKHSDNNGARNK